MSPLSPLSLMLSYDLASTLGSLRTMAKRATSSSDYLPRDLLCAAIAFTVQLAIESGHDAQQLRALESQLIATVTATGTLDEAMSARAADAPRQLTNDEIISVRDALLAKGDIGSLSIHDQNLFRDCDIALGVVRCQPQTRAEARARVSRDVSAPAPASNPPATFR